jgi:hypothetical protein
MNPNANTLITFTISDLVEGTDYDAYCALDDLVSDKIDFYTSRVINSTIATEITGKSVKLVTTFDAAANVRCVVLDAGSDTPSTTQIFNGQDATGTSAARLSPSAAMSTAGTPFVVDYSNLSPGQPYDAYCVQTPSLAADKVSFTTNSVIDQPTIVENFGTSVTISTKFSTAGLIGCVVIASGASPPTASAILDRSVTDPKGDFPTKTYTNANVQHQILYTRLVPGIDYDAYCEMDGVLSNVLSFTAKPLVKEDPVEVRNTGNVVKYKVTFTSTGDVKCELRDYSTPSPPSRPADATIFTSNSQPA